jgi:putative ABC transport system substrate-binding protein
VKRREFIALLGGAAAPWPLAAGAQQAERIRRIGMLIVFPQTDPSSRRRVEALLQGLARLGWSVGHNLTVDYRWGVADDESARTATAELLALGPDLIVANATTALAAARRATGTVPIVFTA